MSYKDYTWVLVNAEKALRETVGSWQKEGQKLEVVLYRAK